MYKAIVFDFDGVILNSSGFREEAYIRLFSNIGINVTPERLRAKAGMTTRDTISRIAGGYAKKGKKPLNVNGLCRRFYYELYNIYEERSEPSPHLTNFLNYCEARKWKIGLACSTPSNIVRMVLKKFGLMKYFMAIVGGEKVVADKPNPEMLLKVLGKLDAKPEDSIAIDGSLKGIIAAKLIGMYAISYLRYSKTVIPQADLSVCDFDDITGL